ncbi:DUF6344 domain-containing protein [Streptomyces diastatochromogenes]|uniref:Secreted protein n=1 Tax=Streptomyces diastatochromogenes TaxID=42236 RepID=A0A233SBU0_STRDA|nr:DUF6344 domain-containing protein [Streptomyces diastatochromogenes]MCZ0988124.1 DUF6344 domain-containing protein [Streptomyces diastatochromogenes]OXY93104.1 hypothetical protein BEK98_23015 [Streptomyces diastatochromogenes]
MTGNRVMKLWTAIVTAFLALCTALGLVTATTATAAPRTESPRGATAQRTVPTIPAMSPWTWSHGRSLPPTMKQRIRAEAHGKSPSCRHRPLNQTEAETDAAPWLTAPLDC